VHVVLVIVHRLTQDLRLVRFFGRLRKLEGLDSFRVLVRDCLFLDLFSKLDACGGAITRLTRRFTRPFFFDI
jgi:hypothetical protein